MIAGPALHDAHAQTKTDAATQTEPAETFESWLVAVAREAKEASIPADVVARAFEGLTPDPDIIARFENQPEHARATGDYVTRAVSDLRIANGKASLAEHETLLDAIETVHGVDRHVVVAIWGMESSYGTNKGSTPIIRALATLGWAGGRRAKYGRAQLIAALKIIARGDVSPDELVGSWAGAMGHTQFIPTTYNAFAVDLDGDGKRDIWNTLGDALASTAHYLKKSGWTMGEPWGFEVALPKNFDIAQIGLEQRRPLSAWTGLGLRRADGRDIDLKALGARPAAVILPAGASGPAFAVLPNFRAILRYNFATSYALAVGHLADRLAGGEVLKQGWPQGDRGLILSEREELQRLLGELGYDTGGVDGILGTKSRAAIRSFQASAGIPADGYPNGDLLERVRAARRGG